ncbi:glycosyltransferase family 4 protein [Candidatus Bipolaricaulota bacterium]|nr:glycosyltransferase family 4 protein [Candidatus Bipolaricaulota bacterium]
MNIGFVSTRLVGTDGVTLETAKLVEILSRSGHESFYCAGELSKSGPAGTVVPEMSFNHPAIQRLQASAFGSQHVDGLAARIGALAARIQDRIRQFVRDYFIDVLVPENALTIPMNLSLGVALTDYIEETGIRTLSHHHDFWWERDRFAIQAVPEILSRCFPPNLPSVRHVVINSLARRALVQRLALDSFVLPNVLDFEQGPSDRNGRSAELRHTLGIRSTDRLFLQPTRVIPRKGIEHSIELVRRLQEAEPSRRHVLLITHRAGDEGGAYLGHLASVAAQAKVELQYLADWFTCLESPGDHGGVSSLTLQDAYEASDFVSYPSLVEGFGNAFLETVFYRRPLLVNRYPVYVADIASRGFRVVEIDGAVTNRTVEQVRALLDDTGLVREVADHNYEVAKRHFSYQTAESVIGEVLSTLV